MSEALGTQGWTRVAFGDVVRLSRERSSDPRRDGFDRYLGLEHIDPGDLKIRRWGQVSDGTTFTNIFRSGQVLFGKRRAYQRKVAVTDFDGVCSGDIYVFEPNGEHLLSQLLPFICQTDGFFQHAVGTSAGSLSPRTNWDSLAAYEFILPPLDDQRRIAQALGAVERAKLTLSALVGATERVCQSVLFELVDRHSERVTTLADVATISVGLAISTSQFYRDQGVPLLRNQNIRPSGLDDRDILFLDPTFAMRHKSKKVKPGDVITTRTGANLGDACVIPAKYDGAHTFTTLITRCDAKTLLPEYLAAHMNSELGKAEIDRLSTSGGKNNLNVGDLRRYQVPIAPLAEQRRACSLLQSLSALIPAQTTRLECLRDMGSLIAAELSLSASTSAMGRHV